MRRLGTSRLLGSSFAVLLVDVRLEDERQGGNLRIQAAHDLGDELILRQDVGQSLDFLDGLHRAVHDTTLDGDRGLLLVLLAAGDELLDHLRRRDRIVVAEHERVRALQDLVIHGDALVRQSTLDQRVLEDAVIDAVGAALRTQSGDLLHSQRLILDDNHGLDVNGNGYIDEGDRKVIGSKRPAFTMSMGNRFRFHDFYCSILLNGVFGKWMQDNVANVTSYTFGAGNYIAGAKYWTPETPEADYVSPGYQQQFSHEYYKKMHYLQIKNITLGYTMPKFVAGKIGMAGIDVNVSVNNVHTFSNMRQMLNYDNTWFASFPTARSYMLGLTLTF